MERYHADEKFLGKKTIKDDFFFYSVRVREYKQHEDEMVFTALFNALKL